MTVTTPSMTYDVPPEADLAQAPNLLEGAATLTLTPQQCGIEYWLRSRRARCAASSTATAR